MPTVVAGFEPLDVLFAIYMILKQISKGNPRLENEYTRAVRWEGNIKAQKLMQSVFDAKDGNWRGLGVIPSSTLSLRREYIELDAHLRYGIKIEKGVDSQPGCKCPLIIVGKARPTECPLFMKTCTPQTPIGTCMVSVEGTCRIWARTVQP